MTTNILSTFDLVIERCVYESRKLNSTQKLIYCFLKKRSNEKGIVKFYQIDVANSLGMNPVTASKAINQLVSMNKIKVIKPAKPCSESIYQVLSYFK